jgi:hypothetical protein
MDINKDLLTLATAAGSVVAMSFLTKKETIEKKDSILKESIKIKHDTETILKNILVSIKSGKRDKERKETIKFLNKLDEIGFLSKRHLIDKGVIIDLFKILQDPRLNAIESIYIRNIYDGNIINFAKTELKISNTDGITTLNDIDIKLRAEFVKTNYPNIWIFVQPYYENNIIELCSRLYRSCICKTWFFVCDVFMLKPIFGAFVIYAFMIFISFAGPFVLNKFNEFCNIPEKDVKVATQTKLKNAALPTKQAK